MNPGMTVLELSARTGDGMEAWMTLIVERIRSKALYRGRLNRGL